MDKQLKDYLHFYLGCDYWTPNSQGNLNAKTLADVLDMLERGIEVRLHLRRLEDMTDAELKERYFTRNQYTDWLNHNDQKWPINDLLWFLENKFDMFDLIREGLAVDKATIKS